MPQPLIELGGRADAPILHIAVANGFPPQTYIPLLRHFFDDYRVVSLPPRALWGDGSPPPVSDGGDWRTIADDLLAGLAQYDLRDVLMVGHSFGGVASILASLQDASRMKAMILLDPTILIPELMLMLDQARQRGMAENAPMAQAARKRRNLFDSVDEAFDRFRDKELFAQWSDATLRLYVQHGTMPDPDGEGRILSWSPAWESYYFSTAYTAIWDELPAFAGVLPTLFVNGSESDTFIPRSARKVAELVPGADYATVEEHGHLFPQSAPDETAQLMQSWLAQHL